MGNSSQYARGLREDVRRMGANTRDQSLELYEINGDFFVVAFEED